MAIRWDEFPHQAIRLKIYARLAHNDLGRAAEDSLRYILGRQLISLSHEDHRRFVELEARYLVEHLRCTRDVYREFADSKGCRPVLEAQWVVLRFAVLPTAIAILRHKVIEYAKLTVIPGRDLSLLFGIMTGSRRRNSGQTASEQIRLFRPPDLEDKTPATDEELQSLGKLIDEHCLVTLGDIRDGGSVSRLHGGGPFATDDYRSILRSFDTCGLILTGMTIPDWVHRREEWWNLCLPWSKGLCGLFGSVQEELMSQWRALPSDSLVSQLESNRASKFHRVIVPAKENVPRVASLDRRERRRPGRKPKLPESFVLLAGRLWRRAISANKTRVSDTQLRQIAADLDAAGYPPPSQYLEHKCAQQLRIFNSRNSNSKTGPILTWSALVSHGDKDFVRGMRHLLSRCSQRSDEYPVSGN
jgi:hypothetical protein